MAKKDLETRREEGRQRAHARREAGVLVPDESIRVICQDLRKHPESTAKQIAARLTYQPETVRLYLNHMKEVGLVIVTYEPMPGGRRRSRWRLVEGDP